MSDNTVGSATGELVLARILKTLRGLAGRARESLCHAGQRVLDLAILSDTATCVAHCGYSLCLTWTRSWSGLSSLDQGGQA